MNVCRFCEKYDHEDKYGLALIRYGVRHYAHPDCLLNAKGARAFEKLDDSQIKQFPALAAHRAGVLDVLREELRKVEELAKPVKLSDSMRSALLRIVRRGDSRGIAPRTMVTLRRRLLVLDGRHTRRLDISSRAYSALGKKDPQEHLCKAISDQQPSKEPCRFPNG